MDCYVVTVESGWEKGPSMLCGLSGPAQVLLCVFSRPPAMCCPENGILALSPACCGTWANYLPSRVSMSMSGPATCVEHVMGWTMTCALHPGWGESAINTRATEPEVTCNSVGSLRDSLSFWTHWEDAVAQTVYKFLHVQAATLETWKKGWVISSGE